MFQAQTPTNVYFYWNSQIKWWKKPRENCPKQVRVKFLKSTQAFSIFTAVSNRIKEQGGCGCVCLFLRMCVWERNCHAIITYTEMYRWKRVDASAQVAPTWNYLTWRRPMADGGDYSSRSEKGTFRSQSEDGGESTCSNKPTIYWLSQEI